MNLLDILLLVGLVAAAVGGWRVGLVARGASWAGIGLGLWATTITVPWALRVSSGSDAVTRLGIALVTLTLTVGLGMALGDVVGWWLRRAVARTVFGPLDRAAGVVAGVAGLLVLVWFLTPAAAEVPGPVSQQVRGSAIVGLIRDLTPPPPDPMEALGRLVGGHRFPQVFEDLRPAPDTGPPPEQIPVPPEVVAAATASTVNVEVIGCGARFEGSGFTVRPDEVVTNAHVVAGADAVRVRRPDGQVLDATVVVFDDDRDLAILHVPGLGQQPLPLGRASPGTEGATIGYPGGQDQPRVEPVTVRDRRPTIGRDIYDEDRVTREVLFLAARLRQGDSGSPVIDAQGRVVGVVFAISPDRPTTAYALDSSELEAILGAPRQPGAGRCM